MKSIEKEIKFETLKKSRKKQIIIGAVLVCLVGSILTFRTTRAKYKVTQSVNIVNGVVNYKVPDLRIVAVNVSEDGENYEIQDDVPTSGYTLNSEKSVCKVSTPESGIENAPKDENIIIEYKDGMVNFLKVSKRNTRCYLYFDKYVAPTPEDTLVKLNITNVKETTPDFSKTATTDEGVFKVEDGMYGGYSYYWRGAVTNNYVKFAGFCWRIIRVNGDGSIRLIYDGNVCHANGTAGEVAVASQAYNTTANNSSYVGWTYKLGYQRPSETTEETETDSNAKIQTESWFSTNITGTNADKVADGKFCNDRSTKNNETWRASGSIDQYYSPYVRIYEIKQPTLSCPTGDEYALKAGAITADEVMYAGGTASGNNYYYLRNRQIYYTMSPFRWYSYDGAELFRVGSGGDQTGYKVNSNYPGYTYGIRPVLNLKPDITISSGNGLQDTPYLVS